MSKKYNKKDEFPYALRVPVPLWKEFLKIVEIDKRSINAEINWLIEKEINQRKLNQSQ